MIKFIVFILLFLSTTGIAQQKILSGMITDSSTSEPLIGVVVRVVNSSLGAKSDIDGRFSITLPDQDSCSIRTTYIGYAEQTVSIILQDDTTVVQIALAVEAHEEEEVVITGTRTIRSIADVSVRVEAIPLEEIEEKIMMRASNVSMLLSETPGLRVQTTSSTSNTTNLRIWGLPGRYTQILTNGIPNLGGLSSGFSITQLPPVNIRQVEIIKGASSILYGADAIGGVVNFILREPDRPEESVSGIINIASEGGQDAALYYSTGKNDALSATVFGSYDRQKEFDVDGDNMSDLAAYDRINIAPQLIYTFSEDLTLKTLFGYLHEDRRGGVMNIGDSAIGRTAPYIEKNSTEKFYATGHLDWLFDGGAMVSANIAGVELKRNGQYGASGFSAIQHDVYADAQYTVEVPSHSLLIGGAVNINSFKDNTVRSGRSLSYTYRAPALFVQDEWTLNPVLRILGGARVDFHNVSGTVFTPRLSFFYKPDPLVTMRLSGGSGFKAPTIFVEEAEETGYKDVRGFNSLVAERAVSISYDLNWKLLLGDEFGLTLNTALFVTRLDNALTVNEDSIDDGIVILENATGPTNTKGFEVTAQLTYDKFKLMTGYTFNYITQEHRGTIAEMELNPRHNLGVILMYEDHKNLWRIGVEEYFIGSQRVDRNPFRTTTPAYWLTGALIEKGFGNWRFYLNFENIFDARHTRYDPAFTGDPFVTGSFQRLHIYAPLEGRSINGGVRYSL